MNLIWLKAGQAPFFRLVPNLYQRLIQHPDMNIDRLACCGHVFQCQVAVFFPKFDPVHNTMFEQHLSLLECEYAAFLPIGSLVVVEI